VRARARLARRARCALRALGARKPQLRAARLICRIARAALCLTRPRPGAAFLAVADEEFGRQIPFGFLEKVKDDFLKSYGETAKNAAAMSLQRTYG
jgi:hypothetical protein